MQTIGLARKLIHGSFAPNGSSALVAASTIGKGFSVARQSAGLFRVTFDEKYNEMVEFQCSLQNADAVPVDVQIGDYVAASRIIDIRTLVETSPIRTVPLDIFGARIIATNEIDVDANHGGIVTQDSAPALNRVNAATDKVPRLEWIASGSQEIQLPPIMKPADLDTSEDITIHLMGNMDGATDTPTVDVQVYDGVGDTEMGGATGAMSDTLAELSATISAANIAAAPGFMSVGLVPAAHTTDVLFIYGAWLEYTSLNVSATAQADLAADANTRVHFEAMMRNTSVDY